MRFFTTQEACKHFQNAPSSISVRSVARLGTKIRFGIATICVKTSRSDDHDKVCFLYVSVGNCLRLWAEINIGREVTTYAGIDFTALPRFVPSSFLMFSSVLGGHADGCGIDDQSIQT